MWLYFWANDFPYLVYFALPYRFCYKTQQKRLLLA